MKFYRPKLFQLITVLVGTLLPWPMAAQADKVRPKAEGPYALEIAHFISAIDHLHVSGLESSKQEVDDAILAFLKSQASESDSELHIPKSPEGISAHLQDLRASKHRNYYEEVRLQIESWKKKKTEELLASHLPSPRLAYQLSHLKQVTHNLLHYLAVTKRDIQHEFLEQMAADLQEFEGFEWVEPPRIHCDALTVH